MHGTDSSLVIAESVFDWIMESFEEALKNKLLERMLKPVTLNYAKKNCDFTGQLYYMKADPRYDDTIIREEMREISAPPKDIVHAPPTLTG